MTAMVGIVTGEGGVTGARTVGIEVVGETGREDVGETSRDQRQRARRELTLPQDLGLPAFHQPKFGIALIPLAIEVIAQI
jgi:hypothetical protein